VLSYLLTSFTLELSTTSLTIFSTSSISGFLFIKSAIALNLLSPPRRKSLEKLSGTIYFQESFSVSNQAVTLISSHKIYALAIAFSSAVLGLVYWNSAFDISGSFAGYAQGVNHASVNTSLRALVRPNSSKALCSAHLSARFVGVNAVVSKSLATLFTICSASCLVISPHSFTTKASTCLTISSAHSPYLIFANSSKASSANAFFQLKAPPVILAVSCASFKD